jgi:hypothetical protein
MTLVHKVPVVLRSSKAVTKETMQMASCFERPSPDPWLGSAVELGCSHSRGLFNLLSIRKTLACKGIATEEPPPALLQVEPARPFGDEHLLDAWMFCQPSTGLGAIVKTRDCQ